MEYASFCDICNILLVFQSNVTVECNLFYCIQEFFLFTFLCDYNLAVLNFNFQTACCKCTAEEYLRCILRDVDETAAASDTGTKSGNIDVTLCVTFCKAKVALIQTAAIIEVELIALVNQSVSIVSGAKTDAASGYAANCTALTALAAGSGNSVARGFDCAVATSPFSFPEPPDFSLRIDGETILEWNAAGNPAILHDAIAEASTHFTLKTGDIILYSLSPTAGNIRRDTKVSFIDSLDNEITSFNIK